MNRFFDSIENQTNKDFNIIFVDDCSSDDSANKLTNYIEKNNIPNCLILSTDKNVGPGGARNCGIKHVRTEYFMFLDSDDYLSYDAIDIINSIAIKDYDCLLFDTLIEDNKNRKRRISFSKKYGPIRFEDALKSSNTGICSKVYKTSIVNNYNISFPNTFNAEDLVFNFLYYSHCISFFHTKFCYYHYVFENNSLSNANLERKTTELSKSINYLRNTELIKQNRLVDSILLKEWIYCYLQLLFSKRASNKEVFHFFINELGDHKPSYIYSVSTVYQRVVFKSINFKLFCLWRFLMRRKLR